MKKLDRDLQRSLLEMLKEAYPEALEIPSLGLPEPEASINLKYLCEHALISIGSDNAGIYGAGPYRVHMATITAKGLDFLADDGGLSAILGAVTVKFHADTLRDLIEAKIAMLPIPASEKRRFVDHFRALTGEALKTITKRLLEEAFDHLPDAIQFLQKLLETAAR